MAASYDYARLEVRWAEWWIWQVHENQAYLGRIVFRLKRACSGSLAELTHQEWQELREEIQSYERAMKCIFTPDRYNYGQLGNIYHQLHVHAVPRYSTPRSWLGHDFRDTRWGNNWAPTPRSPLSKSDIYEFADWLRSELNALLPPTKSRI